MTQRHSPLSHEEKQIIRLLAHRPATFKEMCHILDMDQQQLRNRLRKLRKNNRVDTIWITVPSSRDGNKNPDKNKEYLYYTTVPTPLVTNPFTIANRMRAILEDFNPNSPDVYIQLLGLDTGLSLLYTPLLQATAMNRKAERDSD